MKIYHYILTCDNKEYRFSDIEGAAQKADEMIMSHQKPSRIHDSNGIEIFRDNSQTWRDVAKKLSA